MKYFLHAEEWDKLLGSLPSAEISLKTKNEERKCERFFETDHCAEKKTSLFLFLFFSEFNELDVVGFCELISRYFFFK